MQRFSLEVLGFLGERQFTSASVAKLTARNIPSSENPPSWLYQRRSSARTDNSEYPQKSYANDFVDSLNNAAPAIVASASCMVEYPAAVYTLRTLQVAGSALHTGAGLLGYARAWEGEYKRGLEEDRRGAYLVHLGSANAVLLDGGPELALVDAGFPDKASVVFDAIRQLGRTTRDLRHLIFTHGHPDHIGSAAAIVRETGATTYMHVLDAPFAETGGPFRPMNPAPGLLPRTAYPFVWRPQERMKPLRIDRHMADGETLPIAGGLHVVHIPGHCAGQVAFLWQGERLLIAGDVGMNILGLGDPVGFEDIEEGRRSQRKVATLRFNAAVFGHGRPIHSGASERIRSKWAR